MPHAIKGDEVALEAGQPGSEDGVYFAELPDGATLEVETKHHLYKIVKGVCARARISGHPTYCPEPVTVEIEGSTGKGPALKPGFIGRGMHLIFQHPAYQTVTTSRIIDIQRVG